MYWRFIVLLIFSCVMILSTTNVAGVPKSKLFTYVFITYLSIYFILYVCRVRRKEPTFRSLPERLQKRFSWTMQKNPLNYYN